ncbi:MAG: type I restriction enzyme HsdR N-terminal domain-containing protein [Bacteroidota bacterium]|nr:type I restriction enzyme HsdR N-terminal domain-containing protein [Bacteroidota bacterium]
MHIELTLPEPNLKIKLVNEITQVFDEVRRKFIVFTPEERVRQYIIHFLRAYKNYPFSLMKLEHTLKYYKLSCRADVVIYNTFGQPMMMIECKSPSIKLTRDVFNQITKYNFDLKVPYLLVSNGIEHFCCHIDYDNNKINFLNDIPSFDSLN